MNLTHLDLFSGIGGFALACQWAGIETIGFVEIDKYCQKVLRKHWPDVPIVEDIRDVERIKEIVFNATIKGLERYGQSQGAWQGERALPTNASPTANKEIVANSQKTICEQPRNTRPGWTGSTDNRAYGSTRATRNGTPAILVTAGFPCQPFSVAGKRGSKEDDRYLWPETLAVIEAIKPKWVLLENVTGIVNLAVDTVLSDLEGEGYSWETLVIPACAVNARHRRDRVWIVANSNKCRDTQSRIQRSNIFTEPSNVANSIGREGGSKSRWVTGRIENKGRQRTEDGGEAVCPGTEASLSSQSRQAGDIVPDTMGGQSRESPEPEGGQDTRRGSQEVAIADTQREGLEGADPEGDSCSPGQLMQCGQALANPTNRGTQRGSTQCNVGRFQGQVLRESRDPHYWAVEPELGRVAHGIPRRVDRLKCLGNAIVPQVAYEIIKAIAEIDKLIPQ